MFNCERCGTSFNATIATSSENCPRCRSRDGVDSPLTFKLFRAPAAALGADKLQEKARGDRVETTG